MIQELETRIRERAHSIWEREGRPADRAEAHWSMARAEIAAEAPPATSAEAPKAEAPAKRARKPAAPRSKAAPKHA
ncbi:MAG TPA: DUF2934 domain-containing protein [Amaricoccus sp.]|nr:DUF2934 domain-containing protein [Amaricoccus sp.]